MLLLNHDRFLRNINALLRALGIAQFATDALVCNKVAAFLSLRPAKRKTGSLNRLLGKVKPFPRPLVNVDFLNDILQIIFRLHKEPPISAYPSR